MSIVVQTAEIIEEEEQIPKLGVYFHQFVSSNIVPGAGEVIGNVAEAGDIVAVIDILGAIGNAAVDVYTIVDDPHNALLAIVDLVMAPPALANLGTVAKAAI